MKISEFRGNSLIDYSGKFSSVIFTSGCNFSCPSCHAVHVVENMENRHSKEEIFSYLDKVIGFVDGLAVSGGEPTLQEDLPEFLRKVRERYREKIGIKLDTNGSNPEVLSGILKERLADYVALDVKGSPQLYSRLVGRKIDLRDTLEKSLGIVQNFPDYEFRTTFVPLLEEENRFRWFTQEEVRDMAYWVKGFCPDTKKVKWYIQRFVARTEREMIDRRFSEENLPKEFQETPKEVLLMGKEIINMYFSGVRIRGEDDRN